MREIKFRAWNKELNSMSKPFGFGSVLNFNDRHIKSITDEMIMQYTGLKDKNGKEIYEGDVVLFKKKNHEIRYFDNYGMFAMVGANLYSSNVIDESKPMGSRGSSTNYKPYVLNEYYQKRIEVIGNIYENSELLSNE